MNNPRKIIIISGKRKSGKDYFGDLLTRQIGLEQCEVIRLSFPLKERYAQIHNLDFSKLLDSSPYKEKYRDDMIKWGENERERDPEIFCKLATKNASKPIWIVTDARRPTDIKYFETYFGNKIILVRILCSESTRQSRGWKFVYGIDDARSECALDNGIKWDFLVQNDETASNTNNCNFMSDKITKLINS